MRLYKLIPHNFAAIVIFIAPLSPTFSNTVKRFNIDCQLSSMRPLVSDLQPSQTYSSTGTHVAHKLRALQPRSKGATEAEELFG